MDELTVLRTEEYLFGKPVSIYGEASMTMDMESIHVMSSDPFEAYGDMWKIEWWSGYGQPPTIDVYVHSSITGETSEGFNICVTNQPSEFDECVSRLREGQWKWLLETMNYETGDWGIVSND